MLHNLVFGASPFFYLIVGVRVNLWIHRLIFQDPEINKYINPNNLKVCEIQTSDFWKANSEPNKLNYTL
jgi:hypothetical protein